MKAVMNLLHHFNLERLEAGRNILDSLTGRMTTHMEDLKLTETIAVNRGEGALLVRRGKLVVLSGP
ncbi:MAG: hypothetical protein GY868_20850, partial [Deltaproteobacteria bacterium]|nr:hypothetical protein [Deltaproteobacteria bacterium]